MAKSNKKDHALHNHEVCNFLAPNANYADWVVITAFYSALHFVDHKIFPIQVRETNGNKYKITCVDQYKNVHQIYKDKHVLRAELVASRCPSISASFNWLRSASGTARYSNYTYNNPSSILTTAKAHLDIVKSFCEK